MKRYGSLIALAVVAVLAVVFFATQKEPVTTVKAPFSIAKVDDLSRIELVRPGDELVVLERSDDTWRLTKPIEAPLDERVAEDLDDAFQDAIGTDDLTLSAEKADEFELGDDEAVKVSLYPGDATSPAAEFFVGKKISVPGTRATRTYVKTSEGKLFRAQTDIGEVLRKPLDELRSKTVQKLEREKLKEIAVRYTDGATVVLKHDDDRDWVLVEPQADFKLERGQVSQLVSNVSNLVATGFAEGDDLAALGLDPPHAKIQARADRAYELLLSPLQDGDKYYVKRADQPHVYEISKLTGNALTPTPLSLRSRLVKDLEKDAVTRIELDGEERVILEKKGEDWQFVRPRRSDPVKASAIEAKVNTYAQLRALRFEEPELAETGLRRPDATVTIVADGDRHTLLIGSEADAKGNLWAKWRDSDLIMVVPKWVKERAEASASEFVEEAT